MSMATMAAVAPSLIYGVAYIPDRVRFDKSMLLATIAAYELWKCSEQALCE